MLIYKTTKNWISKILAETCNKINLIIYKLKGKEQLQYFLQYHSERGDQLKDVATREQSIFSSERQVEYII